MSLLGFLVNWTQSILNGAVVCLLCTLPAAAQILPGGAKPEDALDLAIADVAARHGVWRKSHDAVAAAAVTSSACEPGFAAQVSEAREAARRWITSSARAFDLWAVRRSAVESEFSQRAVPAAGDIDGLRALLHRESETFERRKAALTSTLPLERASQSAAAELQSVDAVLRNALDAVAAVQLPSAAPASGNALAASLKPLFGGRARETELLNDFYAAIAQDAMRSCAAERERPEDPFALPAARPTPKRGGKK